MVTAFFGYSGGAGGLGGAGGPGGGDGGASLDAPGGNGRVAWVLTPQIIPGCRSSVAGTSFFNAQRFAASPGALLLLTQV